ncbi:E3 ubiquitin-protein ligase [Carex littledalei]|uniref:RING-type E3 ubiquitin transferase n=1 Tax=Carex littledalei TaxID=544730 RepID=A0A833R690_9POAL|nr:E3 ubiquitin-protein ligase [Carex littledalei]
MGVVFGCFRGENSDDESQDTQCLCLQWSVQPFINVYASLFQRGNPEQSRISPLPGRGTNSSNASSDQSHNNSEMDTYRSPPRPLAYDDPRCSHGQVRRSKSLTGSHDSSESLLRSSSIKFGSLGTMVEERCFSSSVKKVVLDDEVANKDDEVANEDDEVANEVQLGDSGSSSEDEDCPICLEEYTEENPRMFLQCNHDFHLGCIYEWMERSQACPVCAKVMLFNVNP